MGAKPLFLVDWDDTSVNTWKYFNKFMFEKYDPSKTEEDIPEGMNVWDYFGKSFEQIIPDFHEFHKHPYFGMVEPVEDFIYGISMLSRNFTPEIATARSGDAARGIEEVCDELVPGIVQAVHYDIQDKISFAESVGAVAMFDDQFDHLVKPSNTVKKYLQHRTWNAGLDNESINAIRVKNWHHLIELI